MSGIRYVVFGATGHVGSVVAARLLEAGRRVRVVSRSADRLRSFAERGAELAVGSVEDGDFLRRALDGAQAAFVLLPPFFGSGMRAWQERTAATLCEAFEAVPLARVVMLSSIGADLAEGNGPVAGLHAFERRLVHVLGLSSLRLRPGYFFENLIGAIAGIRATGTLPLAFRPDLKVIQIASRDIGEVAARRLIALDWRGNAIQELHGERDLTMTEVAAALGRAIGRPELKYAQLAYGEAERLLVKAGVPEEAAGLYMEMTRGFNEGRVKAIRPRSPETTTPTSIERWAQEIFAPVYAASAPRAATREAFPGAGEERLRERLLPHLDPLPR